jgi:syntaxin-binding protein 1
MSIAKLTTGIDDNLAQKLTRSLPPDVLRAFVELYCDVLRMSSILYPLSLYADMLAVEDRIFSINQPQAFFTMFGNMGGAASADLAIEGFEDDLKLTGRSVSHLARTVPSS